MGIAGPSEIFAEAFAFADTNVLPVSVSALEECDALLIDAGRITVKYVGDTEQVSNVREENRVAVCVTR